MQLEPPSVLGNALPLPAKTADPSADGGVSAASGPALAGLFATLLAGLSAPAPAEAAPAAGAVGLPDLAGDASAAPPAPASQVVTTESAATGAVVASLASGVEPLPGAAVAPLPSRAASNRPAAAAPVLPAQAAARSAADPVALCGPIVVDAGRIRPATAEVRLDTGGAPVIEHWRGAGRSPSAPMECRTVAPDQAPTSVPAPAATSVAVADAVPAPEQPRANPVADAPAGQPSPAATFDAPSADRMPGNAAVRSDAPRARGGGDAARPVAATAATGAAPGAGPAAPHPGHPVSTPAPLPVWTVPAGAPAATAPAAAAGPPATQTGAATPAGDQGLGRAIDPARIQQQVVQQLLRLERPHGGTQQLTLKLEPEHLGKVEIRLTVQGDSLEVLFHAETPAAEAALRDGSQELARTLGSQLDGRWQHVEIKLGEGAVARARPGEHDDGDQERPAGQDRRDDAEGKRRQRRR
ncbi:MAG TPA: flagellar hook-length control protein FliK [Candidatus Krumholzibacteria bacterium]|nr:flagellar hook-length control protein FliK [Candidatus Krumholzibacteria bacterium]HPD71624.1 flagellar hook-length control protein FliK [Candidatus Krumholzibacteria bacterium]HRY41443.1 flagellar hook-length control protein FliK [Candidatus Krumholzibacteria bacterium]